MRIVVALVAALITTSAQAKCLDTRHAVRGVVVLESGKPAANAIVAASWIERGKPAGPAVAVADRKGHYTLYLRFRTFTGIGRRGDECGGKLGGLSLVAFSPQQQSPPLSIPFTGGAPAAIRPPALPLLWSREGL